MAVNTDELKDFDAVVLGCPTYHHDMIGTMKTFLFKMKKVDLKGKVGAAFGAYGWSGEAVKMINKELEAMKFEVIDPGVKLQYVPDKDGIKACYELGKKIARAM